jgi:hypothetical protein
MTSDARYVRPSHTTELFNRVVAALTRLGLSVWGSRILRVRGRTTGEWRSTPVNLLRHDGAEYLVAPRGNTQWVRNLRVQGTGELVVGRRVRRFRATELADVDVFFSGVGPDASDEELLRIAPGYPVFRITTES